MRKTGELLQLLLDNIGSMHDGLCNLSYILYHNNTTTRDERCRISSFISGQNSYCTKSYPYLFEPYEKEPRIKWLNEQIKCLKSWGD